MFDSLLEMAKKPIWPTVYPLSADILAPYMQVLHEQKYSLLEILARPLEQALDVFRQVNELPIRKKITVGFGTVLTAKAALKALQLEPDFIVSPAFSPKVLDLCVEAGVPYIPGISTFQDVQDVLEAFESHGLELKMLKFCPLMTWMTPSYLKCLGGCYPNIRFCVTGSRDLSMEDNFSYRQAPCVGAAIGSQFIPQELLEKKDFETVRKCLVDIDRRFEKYMASIE